MAAAQLSDELAAAAVEAVREHGNVTAAAIALGLPRATLENRYRRALQRQAGAGVDAPEVVRGRSVLYDVHGVARAQWVKTSVTDEARRVAMDAAAASMAERLPRVTAVRPPAGTVDALCNCYVLTDAHIGMLAWHREGGADWDIGIAEQTITGCFIRMVDTAPRAGSAVIAQLGDFLHFDGLTPVTPASGHVLDADSRFSKVVAAAVRILRRIVDYALTRHDRVTLLLAEGNHDESGSVWLRTMFAALYEGEPRLSVDDSSLPYYTHRHGDTMLAFHHGHKRKNADLPLLFAAQFPGIWGATSKRYCHTGHRHHHDEREHSGMTVTQHPTLAARDAYAARGGWLSERQASAITYHARHGRVATTTVTPEMLEAA